MSTEAHPLPALLSPRNQPTCEEADSAIVPNLQIGTMEVQNGERLNLCHRRRRRETRQGRGQHGMAPKVGWPDFRPPCWNLAGGTLGQDHTVPHPTPTSQVVLTPCSRRNAMLPCRDSKRERVEGGQGVGLSTSLARGEEVAPSVAREVCSGSGSHPWIWSSCRPPRCSLWSPVAVV